MNVRISGSGHFLPGKPVSFDELNRYLGEIEGAPPKVAKWFERIRVLMREMLDITHYHFAIDPESGAFTEDNVSMSVKAAQSALQHAGISAHEVDFIAYGSAHQHQMPTASVRIQEALGIENCAEISIHANCTSAYKALMVAADGMRLGRYKKALVISAGMSSSELRSSYYNMPLVKKEELFLRYFLSDGAGALLLEACEDHSKKGLYLEHCHSESVGGCKPSAMGNRRPAYYLNPKEEYDKALHHLAQMFNEDLSLHFNEPDGTVFEKGLKRMLNNHPIDLTKIRYFQINFPSKHIVDLIMDACQNIGIQRHTLYTKLQTMGYTGPPMVFMCLDKILREEPLEKDDILISFVTEVSKFMQAGFVCRYYQGR